MKIAILYICTGKYNQFFEGFYKSCEEYWLKNEAQKEYFVFTDDLSITKAQNVHLYIKECLGFPMDSLLRFEQFLRVKEEISQFDFTFFFNANALFVKPVGKELLPREDDLYVAGVWKRNLNQSCFLPYERNKKSTAYIPPHDGPYFYYGGFFNGGCTKAYIEMAEQLAYNTRRDWENGIIAKVHDESHLNCFLHKHPCTALSPSFIIPEEQLKEKDHPFVILRDKVKLDPYFNKGRKTTMWARIQKGVNYLKNAVEWYF